MGRHSAPVPSEEPNAAQSVAPRPERAAPADATASLRTVILPAAPSTPTTGPAPVPAGRPAPPIGSRPVAARPAAAQPATPAPVHARPADAGAQPVLVPSVASPSLDTGPIAIVPNRRRSRRPSAGRLALAAAGVVTVAIAGIQIGATQSEAAPSRHADTPPFGPIDDRSTDAPQPGSGRSPVPAEPPVTTFTTPSPIADPPPHDLPATAHPVDPTAGRAALRPPARPLPGPTRTSRPSDLATAQPGDAPTGGTNTASDPADPPSPSASPSSPGHRDADGDAGTSSPALDGLAVHALSGVDGDGITLGTGRWRFSDFRGDLNGVRTSGRLVGEGSAKTVLEMAPGSSSKRSAVPHKDWTTNQLSLVKLDHPTTVSGFTLRGTDQGHLYNGLRLSKGSPTVTDVRVEGIPGDDDIPPGETFGINDFHTDGAHYSHVEVDGDGVSASTYGANGSDDVTIDDSSFHDAGHGNGATFWDTKDVTVRNTTSVRTKDAAFNFERVSGHVVLDHVTMQDNKLAHLRIDSDKASATYTIIDPVFDGKKLTIVMTPRYMGHANVQKKSDVHVIIHGVDRTDEVVDWQSHF